MTTETALPTLSGEEFHLLERETGHIGQCCSPHIRAEHEQKLCRLRVSGLLTDEELDRLLQKLDTGACG